MQRAQTNVAAHVAHVFTYEHGEGGCCCRCRGKHHFSRRSGSCATRRARSDVTPKRVHRIACVSFFSCLVVVATSARAKKYGECSNPQSCASPGKIVQLGDKRRSKEASGNFFASLDKDGDGSLRSEEVAGFLRDQIGGSAFDTQSEVDEEVITVMERLDRNDNKVLEISDVFDYWVQLESLLTAEEVSDWIIYAVQLPAYVGEIFLQNGITGYDFPEIVLNGGEVLKKELGINKTPFRNKIVRHVQARMLGIGSVPETPKDIDHKIEGCAAVNLSWPRSTARVFPVHGYRLQRRAINLFENKSTKNAGEVEIATYDPSNQSTLPIGKNSDWETVYVGGETEFVDSELELGHNYKYRVQAWNSVGRSSWQTINLAQSLKKNRCSTKPSHKSFAEYGSTSADSYAENPFADDLRWEWMSTPKRLFWGIFIVVQFLYTFVRGLFGFIAVGAGIIRFKRASASSSASTTFALPFPWLWKSVNKFSRKLTGYEIIPGILLGDRQARILQEKVHDERVMATGLRGYDRIQKKTSKVGANSSKGKELPSHKIEANHNGGDKRKMFGREKSNSTGNLLNYGKALPPKEVLVPSTASVAPGPKLFPWKRHSRPNSNVSEMSAMPSDSESLPAGIDSSTSEDIPAGSDQPSSTRVRASQYIDDGSTCVVCEKKFKFGKRWKHHCSRCMSTFCHKHGHTAHNNFTSCKVPGSCMCNPCLLIVKPKSRLSNRTSTSFGVDVSTDYLEWFLVQVDLIGIYVIVRKQPFSRPSERMEFPQSYTDQSVVRRKRICDGHELHNSPKVIVSFRFLT